MKPYEMHTKCIWETWWIPIELIAFLEFVECQGIIIFTILLH